MCVEFYIYIERVLQYKMWSFYVLKVTSTKLFRPRLPPLGLILSKGVTIVDVWVYLEKRGISPVDLGADGIT